MGTQSWIGLVLTLPVALWARWSFFVRGAQSIVHRSPNMWTLIGVGTGAVFVYSVVATVAPQVFPDSFISKNLRKVDTIVVDKTGTLTEGRPTFERAVGAAGLAQA